MHEFLNGPLSKNIYTHQLQLITKCILHAPNDIQLSFSKNGLQATIAHQWHINVSDVIQKTNFSHIEMNESDSSQYIAQFEHVESHFKPRLIDELPLEIPTIRPITPGEIHAIQEYTQFGYQALNSFLRHHSDPYYADTIYTDNADFFLKSMIVRATLLSSGLNKMLSTEEIIPTYRGEHHHTQDALNSYLEKAGKMDDFVQAPGFISTSASENIADRFTWGKNNAALIFEDDYGKNIDPISLHREKEHLIIPGQKFVITSHEVIEDKSQDYFTKNVFHLKAVEPLIPDNETTTEKELQVFKKLVLWAQDHEVPLDFMSPQLENQLELPARESIGTYVEAAVDNISDITGLHNFIDPTALHNIMKITALPEIPQLPFLTFDCI